MKSIRVRLLVLLLAMLAAAAAVIGAVTYRNVLREQRARKDATPVIVLTARDA